MPMTFRAATPDQEQADLAACRVQLGNGSRTFLAASLLLPRSVRDPACALYAFCRQADDAVDGPHAAADAVDALRARLDAVYDDRPKATQRIAHSPRSCSASRSRARCPMR